MPMHLLSFKTGLGSSELVATAVVEVVRQATEDEPETATDAGAHERESAAALKSQSIIGQ